MKYILTIALATISIFLTVKGHNLEIETSIHEVYQMLHYVCASILAGFACLVSLVPTIKIEEAHQQNPKHSMLGDMPTVKGQRIGE